MFKSIKRVWITFVAVLMVTSNISFAQDYTVPSDLKAYGDRIYSGAQSYFGRSFDGYCGTYVRCQLRAMGIFDDKFDFRGNGNQWYSNFDDVYKTSGGYYVYQESGSDCLQKLTDKYGDSLSNIVISFPIQAGYSSGYPGAGHAFVIYRLENGVAYYSESFSYGKYREGEVIAENAEDLVARYTKRHGAPIGCVLLTPQCLSGDEKLFNTLLSSIEKLSDIELVASEFTQVPSIKAGSLNAESGFFFWV